MRQYTARQLFGFAIVGTIGFLTEAAVLEVLIVGRSWDVFAARAISFPAAVTMTWLLNRAFTFRKHRAMAPRAEYVRYFMIQIVGAGINLFVYSAVIALLPAFRRFPIVPLAIGALLGLLFNFFAARRFVFVGRPLATCGNNGA